MQERDNNSKNKPCKILHGLFLYEFLIIFRMKNTELFHFIYILLSLVISIINMKFNEGTEINGLYI